MRGWQGVRQGPPLHPPRPPRPPRWGGGCNQKHCTLQAHGFVETSPWEMGTGGDRGIRVTEVLRVLGVLRPLKMLRRTITEGARRDKEGLTARQGQHGAMRCSRQWCSRELSGIGAVVR